MTIRWSDKNPKRLLILQNMWRIEWRIKLLFGYEVLITLSRWI